MHQQINRCDTSKNEYKVECEVQEDERPHVFGSIVAAKSFMEKNRPNIIF